MYNHESSSIAEKFLDPKAPDIQPPNPKYEESSSSKQPTPRYERNEAVQKAKQDMQQLVESHAEVKQAQEQTKCFTILFLFFSHFFPSVIKKQTSVMLQFVGGALAFIGLISLFLWLFLVYYNKCDVQLLETSEIPTNMVECKQRLLAQDTQLKIDIQGKWSNEEDYDFLGSGGPWQVQWKAYKANATIFHENMNSLLQQVQYQTSKWNNLPFFDVAEEAFFFQYQVQWTDFECEGAKVQRAHQPRSVCQGKINLSKQYCVQIVVIVFFNFLKDQTVIFLQGSNFVSFENLLARSDNMPEVIFLFMIIQINQVLYISYEKGNIVEICA
eukprot:TRINITY_DN14902_c0_g1_i10.p1 TRINITY_DN14902_c0_g1~~TRINITY_DN14902_c0_g1_i10.p1  ORF type:complete len:344 (-),score=5.55 TRINITY_DN14902_c0_g1_i10:989-1972(-)